MEPTPPVVDQLMSVNTDTTHYQAWQNLQRAYKDAQGTDPINSDPELLLSHLKRILETYRTVLGSDAICICRLAGQWVRSIEQQYPERTDS